MWECSSCKEHFRMDRFVPQVQALQIKYCPLCGQATLAVVAPTPLDTTRWQSFARDAEVEFDDDLIQQLYEIWDWQEIPSFIDFILKFKEDLAQEDLHPEIPAL